MADLTLFDDMVSHPAMANMTQYLLIGMAPDGHGKNDAVIRAIMTHPESVRMFGDLLGRMVRENYGVEDGAQFLTEFTAAAAMALHGHSLFAVEDSQ